MAEQHPHIGRRRFHKYVYIKRPDHPRANKAGYVPEHTVVLEDKLGRYLVQGEVAHHINGDPQDNRPENLQPKKCLQHWQDHARKVRLDDWNAYSDLGGPVKTYNLKDLVRI